MNKTKLAAVLREISSRIADEPADHSEDVKDAAEVCRVMARVLLGDNIERAFGAIGDWGYETAIGKALAERQP